MIKFLLVFLVSFQLISCQSTKVTTETTLISESNDDIIYEIPQSKLKADSYVFIRLYDISYKKKFSGENLLKHLISVLGTSPDGRLYSHSAINWSLNDSFVGLTRGGDNEIKIECCTNPTEDDFLYTNNQSKSRCTVLAIPCSKNDRNKVKKLLQYSVAPGSNFKYHVLTNAAMPLRHKKILKKYESNSNQVEYPFDDTSFEDSFCEIDEESEVFETNSFICSTYVTYVLQSAIDRIRLDFQANNVCYNEFIPGDLFFIDGAFELFNCSYENYESCVKKLIKEYPELKKYH